MSCDIAILRWDQSAGHYFYSMFIQGQMLVELSYFTSLLFSFRQFAQRKLRLSCLHSLKPLWNIYRLFKMFAFSNKKTLDWHLIFATMSNISKSVMYQASTSLKPTLETSHVFKTKTDAFSTKTQGAISFQTIHAAACYRPPRRPKLLQNLGIPGHMKIQELVDEPRMLKYGWLHFP